MAITAPTDISNCLLWLKPGDWYSDAGTTRLSWADQYPCYQWNDSSGGSRHVTQATATLRPWHRTPPHARSASLENDEFVIQGSQTISSWSVANPTVCTTAAAHKLRNNDCITVSGATTTNTVNGTHQVTVLSATTFSIPIDVSSVTANGSYVAYTRRQMAIPAGVTTNTRGQSVYVVCRPAKSWLAAGADQSILQLGAADHGWLSRAASTSTLQISNPYTTTSVYVPSSLCIIGYRAGSASCKVFCNDQTQTLSALTANTSSGGNLFGYGGSFLYPFFGSIQEVIVYSNSVADTATLSDADHANVIDYLRRSNGIGSAPVARVIFEGDSRTAGTKEMQRNLNLAQQCHLPNDIEVFNTALTSQLVSDMTTSATAQILPLVRRDIPTIVVLGGAGINDLLALASPATVYDRIVTFCQTVRSYGAKVIVGSVGYYPSGGADGTTDVTTLNGLLSAGWPSFADGYADTANDYRVGRQAAASDTYWYPDGLHPGLAATGALAEHYSRAIVRVLKRKWSSKFLGLEGL